MTYSTKKAIPDMSIGNKNPGAGRPRRWHENMQARFEAGTIARIGELLKDGETKVEFVNDAVIREIARREKRSGPRERSEGK
jgi:hypothetical protein